MKIYFDGCSWTEGAELDNPREERFSKLICKKLGAEEYNISKSGASNERIVRQLLVDNDISEYDLAVIQMTIPSRTEYYDHIMVKQHQTKPKWRGVSIQGTPLWKPWKNNWRIPHVDFWVYYYDKIYNQYYGKVKEKIVYQTIKNHCKVNNVPLILMTIYGVIEEYNFNKTGGSSSSDLIFDLELEDDKYPRATGGHPSSEGHRIIAEDILSLLTKHK